MKIACSKYNEVRFQDVKDFLTRRNQIIFSRYNNGCFLGSVVINDVIYPLYAGDDVVIYNVQLSLAYADESYFDCELEINEF